MPKIVRWKSSKIFFLGQWFDSPWKHKLGWYHAKIRINHIIEVKMRTIMRMRTDEAFRHPLHM